MPAKPTPPHRRKAGAPKPTEAPKPTRCGFVALCGRPNVGKSTLLNQLLDSKVAITSTVAQTTRHRIKGVVTFGQTQCILTDTPGFSKALDTLGDFMVAEGQAALQDADVCLVVVDGTEVPGPGDHWVCQQALAANTPIVMAVNKLDRLAQNARLKQERLAAYTHLLASSTQTTQVVGVSAKTGLRRQALLLALEAHLPESPFFYDEDTLTDQPLRNMAAELIREQVMRLTREELPHSVAVQVEQFVVPDTPTDPIQVVATMMVNQPSQKGMLIGKQGQLVKKIRKAVEAGLSTLCERKATVELHVAIEKNWRKNTQLLKQLGYN